MRRSSIEPRATGRASQVASRLRGDDGSVLAEAALLTPLFIVLLFGVLEFGGAFRDYLTLGNTSLAGTRQAAIQGNAATADWNIVQAVKGASNAMPLSQINMVVVYKAAGPTTPVPAACLTASQLNSCNRYTQTELQLTTMPGTWANCTGPDQYYCPTTRNVLAPNAATNPNGPDYVGVYVQITHPWITGLFGSKIIMSDTSVTRLEPQKL